MNMSRHLRTELGSTDLERREPQLAQPHRAPLHPGTRQPAERPSPPQPHRRAELLSLVGQALRGGGLPDGYHARFEPGEVHGVFVDRRHPAAERAFCA
jgi:hypothetical protein